MKKNNHLKPITIVALLTLGTCSWADNNKLVIEKSQQELDAISQSQQGLEVKTHADGSSSIDLKGRFQMYSVAKMVDGKIVYSCQDHEHIKSNGPHQHETKTAVKRGVQ